MTKKAYMQPVMAVLEADTEQQFLAASIQTNLDDLDYNGQSGNQSEAWVRGNGRVNWDDDWSN